MARKYRKKVRKNFQGDPDDYRDQYDDMLDDVCETVRIGSLEYLPSEVLKCVDPIAYRVGLHDYVDSIEDQ